MKNKLPEIYEYVNSLKNSNPTYIYPSKKLNMNDMNVWKIRFKLLKDDWKYSLKPMIFGYNLFDFKTKINEYGDKENALCRFKNLIFGVFFILKSTFTYVPLGYKR